MDLKFENIFLTNGCVPIVISNMKNVKEWKGIDSKEYDNILKNGNDEQIQKYDDKYFLNIETELFFIYQSLKELIIIEEFYNNNDEIATYVTKKNYKIVKQILPFEDINPDIVLFCASLSINPYFEVIKEGSNKVSDNDDNYFDYYFKKNIYLTKMYIIEINNNGIISNGILLTSI